MSRRRTRARVAIATELLVDRAKAQWGYELSRRSGVGAGSMYPFLDELLAGGYLTDGWEEERPNGRPPRRYYSLTDEGVKYLRQYLGSAPARRRPVQAIRPQPAVD